MSARPLPRRVTVEEFHLLPNPNEGYFELHHGEVVLMAPPKWGHQRIQERVRDALLKSAQDKGIVMVEMAFQPTPEHEVWSADVGLVARSRAEETSADDYLRGAPSLVVEVLSPSNTVEEIADKMAICMDNGCSSFWVIDAKRKQVVVHEGDLARRYGISAAISCDVVGVTVLVEDLFDL